MKFSSVAVGAKHSEQLQIVILSGECFALPAKRDFPQSYGKSIRERAKHFDDAVIFQLLLKCFAPTGNYLGTLFGLHFYPIS